MSRWKKYQLLLKKRILRSLIQFYHKSLNKEADNHYRKVKRIKKFKNLNPKLKLYLKRNHLQIGFQDQLKQRKKKLLKRKRFK